jgi:uncharacterized membrane protein
MRAAPLERLNVLDALRGIAMLLVCTAHFIDVYATTTFRDDPFFHYLFIACKMATPSFVLVSGIVLGHLSSTKHEGFAQRRVHLLDRALFVIIAGHFLVAATFVPKEGLLGALARGYVTDTIGLCVLGGLLVLRYVKMPSTRLGLGLLMYVLGWVGWNTWHPDHPLLVILRGILLGPDDNHGVVFYFPLLSWFGLYLIGTHIGGWLGTFERPQLFHAGKRLIWISSLMVCSAIAGKFILVTVDVSRSLYLPFFSYSKVPPGPFYVLTFGGAALFLLGTLLLLSRSVQTGAVLRLAERMGRNSLSLYLTQSFLCYIACYLFMSHIYAPPFSLALLLLMVSLVGMMWVSGIYERFRLNRIWTVGLTPQYKTSPTSHSAVSRIHLGHSYQLSLPPLARPKS